MTDIRSFRGKVKSRVGAVVRLTALDIFNRVTKKTPVDTGRARAGWNLAIGHADLSVPPEGQENYPAPTPKLGRIEAGDTVVLSDNVPYIGELENGHSKQAPAGMVRLSIEETKTAMGGIVREVSRGA